MIGKTISHYKILEKLGEGGMGVVYKARHLKLDSLVALKFLPSHIVSQGSAKKRFIHEARATSSLEHPNICAVHDIDETPDGHMFIVMPCYQGATLQEKIESGPLDFNEAIDIAVQIASGLAKAHANGITHRDIKPANIFLTNDGYAKILDFGLAKLAGQSRMTRTGTTVGTVRYMSPEQARGEETDEQSDVFSLGVVFYELLTGTLPFAADHEQAVIYRITTEDPEPLSRHRAGLPAGAQRVMDKALAKNRGDRYPNAGELLEDLKRLQEGLTVSRAPQRIKLRKFARPAVWSSLGLLVVTAAYFGFSRLAHDASDGAPQSAVSQNVVAVFPFSFKGGEKRLLSGEAMVTLLSVNLDGAGDLRAVDPNAVINRLARQDGEEIDVERAEILATDFGAGLYIMGSIVEVGGKIQAVASLYRVGVGLDKMARAIADSEAQIFELVDNLARQLLVGSADEVTDRWADTSTSLDAFKAYLEGERLMRAGDHLQAMRAFEQAVEADSLFGRAWLRFWEAASYTGGADAQRVALEKARTLRDKLSPHDQLALDAHVAYGYGQFEEAERALQELLSNYPDDAESWFWLADVILHSAPIRGRPVIEAWEPFQRALELGFPENAYVLHHLSWVAGLSGQYDVARTMADRLLTRFPDSEFAPFMRVVQAFLSGDAEKEEQALAQLKEMSEINIVLAATNVSYAGNLSGSEQVWRFLAQPPRRPLGRGLAHLSLAHLELAHGRWNNAKKQLAAAADLDPPDALIYRAMLSLVPFVEVPDAELELLRVELLRWDADAVPFSREGGIFDPNSGAFGYIRAYLLGLLSVRLGDIEGARGYADELERRENAPDARVTVRSLHSLLRALADPRASPEQVLERLEALKPAVTNAWWTTHMSAFCAQVYERYQRAELLTEMGRDEEALRWYQSVFGQQGPFDVVYAAPSHLKMARIYESMHRTDDAIAHYRQFIAMWNDCDPEFRPQLDEAKKELARLQSSS